MMSQWCENVRSDIATQWYHECISSYRILCRSAATNGHVYRIIVGIFHGKTLSRIGGKMEFSGEKFRGLLTRTIYCPTEPSNNRGENFC